MQTNTQTQQPVMRTYTTTVYAPQQPYSCKSYKHLTVSERIELLAQCQEFAIQFHSIHGKELMFDLVNDDPIIWIRNSTTGAKIVKFVQDNYLDEDLDVILSDILYLVDQLDIDQA